MKSDIIIKSNKKQAFNFMFIFVLVLLIGLLSPGIETSDLTFGLIGFGFLCAIPIAAIFSARIKILTKQEQIKIQMFGITTKTLDLSECDSVSLKTAYLFPALPKGGGHGRALYIEVKKLNGTKDRMRIGKQAFLELEKLERYINSKQKAYT